MSDKEFYKRYRALQIEWVEMDKELKIHAEKWRKVHESRSRPEPNQKESKTIN